MKAGYNRAGLVHCLAAAASMAPAAAFSANTARAALTWDASGSGTAFDGGGTWNSTGANWWNGSSPDVAWDMVSVAQFGVGSGGNNQYSVSVGSPLSVGGLSFQNQNYTLAGSNTLTIAGSGIVAAAPVTIDVPLALSSSQTWTVAAGKLLEVNGAVSGGYGLTTTGGTTVLAGNDSYSGGTVVAGGKLFLDGANATPSISVSGAATLGGTGSASSALATVATGGTLNFSQNTGSTFALAGLTFTGSATLLVNDANGQYSATPAVSAGNLTTGHGTSVVGIFVSNVPAGSGVMQIVKYSGAIGGGGYGSSTFKLKSPLGQGRSTYNLTNNTSADVIELVYTADFLHWTGTASTAWDTSTANWILNSTGAATTYIDNPPDIVVFDDGAGTRSTVSLAAAVHPTSTTFSNTASSYLLEGAGGIYGGGSLTVKGAGVVTLATSNGYTGGTNITSGTLNDGAAGSLGNGPLSVTGGVANLVNPQSISAATLGGGLLNVNNVLALGSGTLAISGGTLDNTSGAAMTLSANMAFNGSFTFRGSNPLNTGTGPVTISGGPTLNVSASTLTVAGPIAGAGGLTKSGNGTLVLLGSNTYSGTTTVAGGNLIGSAASLPGPINLANNANLTVNQTVTGTFGQTISGNGGLILQGGGTLNMSASQNYSGPTVIMAGTLQLQPTYSIGIKFSTGQGGAIYNVTGAAGVVAMSNWNNLTGQNQTTPQPLADYLNNPTPATVAWSGVNDNWSVYTANQTNQNAQLLNSYLDNTNVTPQNTNVTVSGVPYAGYSVYVYLASDGNSRTGIVSIGNTTYDYQTDASPFPGFVQTTDTTGVYPAANYAVFTGLSGSSFSVLQHYLSNNNGIAAVEIVSTPIQVLPATTNVQLASGATLDLNGGNQTVASLADVVPGAGGSIVTNSSVGSLATLTLSPTGGSTTFSGTISDGNGMVALTLAGSGTQVLTGSNAYSGNTTIAGGVLQAVDGVSLPTASNLVFSGSLAQTGVGAILQSSGTFSRMIGTGSGNVQWTGDGGFAAVGGPLTVSMSPGVPLLWSTVNFVTTGSVLTFGSQTANNQVNFTDTIDLTGGTRQIDVAQGAGGDSVLLSGNLIDSYGGAGLLKTGAGILILSGTNSYLGGTMVEGGTLIAAVTSALPGYLTSGSVSVSVNSGATLAVQAGALPGEFASTDVDNVRTTATFASGANFGIQVVAPESFTYNSNIGNSAAGPLGFVKLGSGELILSGHNTYTGGTTVLAGTLVAGSATALADGTSLTVGQGESSLFAPAVAGPAVAAPSEVVAVPEPASLALVLVALGIAAAYRRFRRK